jgi:hypothetical protein
MRVMLSCPSHGFVLEQCQPCASARWGVAKRQRTCRRGETARLCAEFLWSSCPYADAQVRRASVSLLRIWRGVAFFGGWFRK